MSDDRQPVTVEEARAMLSLIEDYDPGGGEGPCTCVHTYRPAPFGLIGAHRELRDLEEAMRTYGVELAGPNMTALGHGLVLTDDTGPMFLATKDAA